MPKFVCPNCEKENPLPAGSPIPDECTFCFGSIPPNIELVNDPDTATQGGVPIGLTLIYQRGGAQFEVSNQPFSILGREHVGSSLLFNILVNGKPVISRKHCSIEFKNGQFYLSDEGSVNGTFYGVNKISCANIPQRIEDNSILYLGQEPFLARINYQVVAQTPLVESYSSIPDPEPASQSAPTRYRCNEPTCGYEAEVYSQMCPDCATFNSMIAL